MVSTATRSARAAVLAVALCLGSGLAASPALAGPVAAAAPTAPDTTIDSGPDDLSTVSTTSVTFTFSGSDGTTGFTCQVDEGTPFVCTSPHTLADLASTPHSFKVAAHLADGRADDTPAVRTFRVSAPTAAQPTSPPPATSPAPPPATAATAATSAACAAATAAATSATSAFVALQYKLRKATKRVAALVADRSATWADVHRAQRAVAEIRVALQKAHKLRTRALKVRDRVC